MSKPYTVKELLLQCQEQIKNGNGDKIIMISQDDEGNGYHYLWYAFCDVEDAMAEDFIDERIADEEDTIILG